MTGVERRNGGFECVICCWPNLQNRAFLDRGFHSPKGKSFPGRGQRRSRLHTSKEGLSDKPVARVHPENQPIIPSLQETDSPTAGTDKTKLRTGTNWSKKLRSISAGAGSKRSDQLPSARPLTFPRRRTVRFAKKSPRNRLRSPQNREWPNPPFPNSTESRLESLLYP
jgi:hypothetical protein